MHNMFNSSWYMCGIGERMRIKGITEIHAVRNGCIKLSLVYDGNDQTVIYVIGANMRINVENSNDIEVFIDERGYPK